VQPEGERGGRDLGEGLGGIIEIEAVKPAQPARAVAGLDELAQLRERVAGAA